MKDYYIGLDIGTNSVGWAVTDLNYKVIKFKRKSMWGVRLFEEGLTAKERRGFRTARRRKKRERERIALLQEFFAGPMEEVDPEFFLRLNESKFYPEDKQVEGPNSLFNNDDYKDQDFHRDYPTFYHLRKELMEDGGKKDLRKIYLGLQHILKLRGHFLFPGSSMESVKDFRTIFEELNNYLEDEYGERIDFRDLEKFEEILKSKDRTGMDKARELKDLCIKPSSQQKAIIDLMAGRTVGVDKLLDNEDFKENEIKKIDFKSVGFEDQIDTIRVEVGEKYYLIEIIKAIYDWSILEEVLGGQDYISWAKVESYDQHARDLSLLKKLIRKYKNQDYSNLFRNKDKGLANYSAYVGKNSKSGSKKVVEKRASQEDFYKYLKKILNSIEAQDPEIDYVLNRIEVGEFLNLQRNTNNSTIPNQINRAEYIKILDQAAKHYDFLNQRDNSGLSVRDKLIKVFEFRIPYYVGPLNDHSEKYSWLVKKQEGKIYPWNFGEMVDLEKSGERFIKRMTNKCSYLIGEDVLAKDSIIYSKFTVLNEINNLRINGEPIGVGVKQGIFENLCLVEKKLSLAKIKKYLISYGYMTKDDTLSGVDINLGSSMKSYIDIKKIIGDRIDQEKMLEDITLWISLFTNEEKLVYGKIKREYGDILSDDEIKKLSRLKYSGWGRLSEKLLREIYILNNETGEMLNIIQMMWETNHNLVELLGGSFAFSQAIEEENKEGFTGDQLDYESLEELGLSPAVKKSLWQTVLLVKELVHIMGCQPRKIFIDLARDHGEKRWTSSRKKQLEELYKNTKKKGEEFLEQIKIMEDRDFRPNRLYLYYLQNGKCLYTGEAIDLDRLYDKTSYDIDHIYPRSVTKDNSLDNLVLVTRASNAKKTDKYPIEKDIQARMDGLWKYLKINKFISGEKYKRLTRKTDLGPDERAGFIARQLIETRQSSKAAGEILKQMFDTSEIVYVKAENVSDFRHSMNLVRVRELNNHHYAKDAYLNVVVGNVYHTKFTSNPIDFVKTSRKREYNLEKMFDFNVERNGLMAWDKDRSFGLVKNQMEKNNILVTKKPIERRGGFFKQKLVKKGKGQYPIKTSDERFKDFNKYGGYNKISNAYFSLVEHKEKGKLVRTIEKVPIIILGDLESGRTSLEAYYRDQGLVDPKILLNRILINSLLKFDGYRLNITGSTGINYVFSNSIELIVDQVTQAYIKKLAKLASKLEASRGDYEIDQYDRVSSAENMQIYKIFSHKLNKTIYNKIFSKFGKLLEDEVETFEALDLKDQVHILMEILKFFQTDRRLSDLKKIKGTSSSGVINKSKKITNYKQVSLIHQSITGLYEQELDLLKL